MTKHIYVKPKINLETEETSMKKTKVKVMLAVLMAGVLLSGTMIANADGCYGKVGNYSVGGETYVNTSNGSAYCRTVSSSYNVTTGIAAWYSYYDYKSGDWYITNSYDGGKYGCEVNFNLPSGTYNPLSAGAEHSAGYDGVEWGGISSEDF